MESRGAIETGPLNFRVHAVQRNPVFSIDRSKFSSMIELLFERVYVERKEKEREREKQRVEAGKRGVETIPRGIPRDGHRPTNPGERALGQKRTRTHT